MLREVKVSAENHPAEILSIKSPELSTINRGQKDKENGYAMLEVVIVNMVEFYGEPWNPTQVRECAELIYDEYYWLHLAELKHFLLKAKKGTYGKIFGKFSPAVLMDWIGQYAAESQYEREQMSIRDAGNQKKDTGAIAVEVSGKPSEEYKQALNNYQNLMAALTREVEEEAKEDPRESREQSPIRPEAYAQMMKIDLDDKKAS